MGKKKKGLSNDPRLPNFTPVVDELVQELGLTTAGVWGVIWRYCQLKDSYCWASYETIGDKIGKTAETVRASVTLLIRGGYVKDLAPDDKGKTKHLKTTSKLAELPTRYGSLEVDEN